MGNVRKLPFRIKPLQFKLKIEREQSVRGQLRDCFMLDDKAYFNMPHSKNPGILAALNSEAVQTVLAKLKEVDS